MHLFYQIEWRHHMWGRDFRGRYYERSRAPSRRLSFYLDVAIGRLHVRYG